MTISNAPASTGVPSGVAYTWPGVPPAVRRARHHLHTVLTEWGMRDLAGDAEVVLAELMTNSVQHARGPAGALIETRYAKLAGGALRLEVHDRDDAGRPRMRTATAEDTTGRGLPLVDHLTRQRWGVRSRPGAGKYVWAVVGGPPPGAAAGAGSVPER